MKKFTLLFTACFLYVLVSGFIFINSKAHVTGVTPLRASISSITNIRCNGDSDGSATVFASRGTMPYTYLWLPDSNTTTTNSGLAAGTYTVYVRDAANDSVILTVTITQPNQLRDSITSSHNVTCPGAQNGSATVGVVGGTPPYTYLWLPGGNTSNKDSDMSPGVYYVTVTDLNGCSATSNVNITLLSNPVGSVSVTNVSCFGEFNGTGSIHVSGGVIPFKYEWLPIPDTTQSVTGLPAGTYTGTATDALGCKVQGTASVHQPAPLVLTASAIANIAAAYASGGTAPYTYAWYPPVSTTSIATGLSAGSYTVTIHDANLCSDSAVVYVPVTALNLALGNGGTECASYPGNPSYFIFSVFAYSNPPTIFNNCVIDVRPGSQFWGDSVSNGGIIVTQGGSFPYVNGDNDYIISSVINLPDSTIQITFGSPIDSSPRGTLLDTVPKVLLNVQLKMQDCEPSAVTFANPDSTTSLSFYSLTYKTVNHVDSTLRDTLCCPHTCDSLCNPHNCNPILLWNNITSSYDTSWTICFDTCPYTCFDTAHYYAHDTVYNYFAQNFPYTATNYAGEVNAERTCPMLIGDFTHKINAGTNAKSVSPDPLVIPENSSILAIEGYGFGNHGKIMVCSADEGFDGLGHEKMIPLDSIDILRWSDTWIKVKMPSAIIGAGLATPGSGPIIVYNSCGDSASLNFMADNTLQINYSILNDDTISLTGDTIEKLTPNIVMSTDSNSFVWRFDTSIWNNPKALGCFKKAIRTWNCYTGVNWKIGGEITLDTTLQDGISDIYFYTYPPNDSTTLMETRPQYFTNSCFDSYDSVTFLNEADIKVRRNDSLWSYDTTDIPTSDSDYFYNTALHELGHAHGLGHINDTSSLMCWVTGIYRRSIITGSTYPGPATLLGALDMIHTSIANSPGSLGCGSYHILVPSFRGCIDPTLNTPYIPDNLHNLALFPNPVNMSDINIAYELTQNSSVLLKIEDCTGRVIMKLKDEKEPPGTYGEKINLDALAGGVYLFTANINGQCQTIKFIKL